MDELDQSNVTDENTFVSDLIYMTKAKDKVLKKFIDENLFLSKSSLDIKAISKNIEALKTMDNIQQSLVIGRADHFKESNDPSKYFPSLLVFYGLIIALYGQLGEITGIPIITFIATLIMLFVLSRMLLHGVSIYPTAVYFHSLVTKIKYEN